jgi:hypothetical protein
MFLLSYGFGFMSQKTAEELASTNSERAVIVVLAPVCADRFPWAAGHCRANSDAMADKDDSYKMREAFPERYDHLAGQNLSGF